MEIVDVSVRDTSKWPYRGHMSPGDHDDFPDGCQGNCDGVCEGYGRDAVLEELKDMDSTYEFSVKQRIRIQDERDRYKTMIKGLEARVKQAEFERDRVRDQLVICMAGLVHYVPQDCDKFDDGRCAKCRAIKAIGVKG
jgi:hypothetical protein